MSGSAQVQKFRNVFAHTHKNLGFFPMHMARGVTKVQSSLKNVDCVIEVHDARVPISGRNSRFEETVAARPRVLLLNKVDLIDPAHIKSITRHIQEKNPDIKQILYSCCKTDTDHTIRSELLPSVLNIVKSGDRYSRSELNEYGILVIGIPNVGKSTLINALRSIYLRKGGKATPVGAKPGITRSVMERIKVCEVPKVYVLDTPGILPPSIYNMDTAFKLALCDIIQSNILRTVEVADYLLFYLNKSQIFSYVDLYEIPQAVDDIYLLLTHIAKKGNMVHKLKSPSGGYNIRPNFEQASTQFIRDFRSGKLGKIILDSDLIGTN